MGYAFAIDLVNHSSQLTRISPASRSPGEELDIESGTWVTVFGFPPSQASHVLKLFQEIGEVVRHKTPLGQCNWMHIQYEESLPFGFAGVIHFLTHPLAFLCRCQIPDKDTGPTSALQERQDVWWQPDGGRNGVHRRRGASHGLLARRVPSPAQRTSPAQARLVRPSLSLSRAQTQKHKMLILNMTMTMNMNRHQIDLYGPKVPKRSDSTWSKIMEYVIGA